jgi:hypothetical protein
VFNQHSFCFLPAGRTAHRKFQVVYALRVEDIIENSSVPKRFPYNEPLCESMVLMNNKYT